MGTTWVLFWILVVVWVLWTVVSGSGNRPRPVDHYSALRNETGPYTHVGTNFSPCVARRMLRAVVDEQLPPGYYFAYNEFAERIVDRLLANSDERMVVLIVSGSAGHLQTSIASAGSYLIASTRSHTVVVLHQDKPKWGYTAIAAPPPPSPTTTP